METSPVDDTAIPEMRHIGAFDVAGHLLHSLGVNSLSGIKGLSELPHGADAAAQAISDYQDKFSSTDLSPEGQDTIRDTVAPIYRGVQDAFHTKDLSAAYGEGAQHFSDRFAKYGPEAAGVAGAVADMAPMMIGPEGIAGKGAVVGDVGKLIDKYAPLVKQIQETGGVTYHPGTGTQPKSGYAVSLHKGREVALPQAPDAMELARYTHANRDAFESDPGAHVGVWHDPASGQHFMDVSHVDPDFQSALQKAKANDQLGIFDLERGETIPTDNTAMHFLHMSNLSDPDVTLDPAFYGTGIKGAEAKRGGTKVTSLYPSDLPLSQVEHGLESKTPYRVSVPSHSMYDLSADSEGHLSSMPDFSAVEDSIRDAGYGGYHVPGAEGILRGQGRLFGPHPATRLGPGPAPEAEEDLSQGFADGGTVGPLLGDLGSLVAHYAPEADHLASVAANEGKVTYNPTSGNIHTSGYAVPTQAARSVAMDHPPDPVDIHDYMLSNQDAFDDDPNAALHVHSNGTGHFMHVAHVTPDFGHASDLAAQHGLPGFQDLASGEIHPANHGEATADADTSSPQADQSLIERYLSGPPRVSTPWTPGQQTVANPKRNAFPGIYNDPRQVISDASAKVGPEDPLLQQLFGVSRSDLSELALSRQGNELGRLPGAKQNPTGNTASRDVMTPANEQRLIDVLAESRNSPELFKGMTGWYAMDPLYQRFEQIYGSDEAPAKYAHFNTLMGMASPGSDVGTEIARGTSAHWLSNEGRFNDFVKHGGGMSGDPPADMSGMPGHVYHATAHSVPMGRYLDTGSIQMKSLKVPPYIQASGVPQTGFQTDLPVGDAHWARGVGLADVRGDRSSKGQPMVPAGSVTTPEMQTLAPWWRDRVAGPAGLESVPAQAMLWGAMSPYTGVESAIGAPKLEILSTQIGKLAQRLGVSPETARDLVISGKAGAFSDGGHVPLG